MNPPTEFEIAVMRVIAASWNGCPDVGEVRRAVSQRIEKNTGRRPHQAAVSCNITKFAWRETYVRIGHANSRFIVLTPAGKTWIDANPV